jgi:hypothetical protein
MPAVCRGRRIRVRVVASRDQILGVAPGVLSQTPDSLERIDHAVEELADPS